MVEHLMIYLVVILNNTNDKPFIYYWDNDGTTKKIVVKDIDLDSPSYEQEVIGEI